MIKFGKSKGVDTLEQTRVLSAKEMAIKEAEATRLAAQKSFDNLKSICLECKHAFIEKYIDNPTHPVDPMDVVCRKKIEVWGAKAHGRDSTNFYQCWGDKWVRKTLSCSDFDQK